MDHSMRAKTCRYYAVRLIIGKDGKLTSVINGQKASMSPDQTKPPVVLSEENKALLKRNCSALGNLVVGKTLIDLIKVREEG